MLQSRRHESPTAAIEARTHQWSIYKRLGYGLFALTPLVLLGAALAACLAQAAGLVPLSAAAGLVYVHVGSQFIVLLVFGDLLFQNRSLTDRGRTLWGLYFLVLAPAAVLGYWYVHVWRAEGQEERRLVVERYPEPEPTPLPEPPWRRPLET